MSETDQIKEQTFDSIFKECVNGKYRIGKGLSSAAFWAPKEQINVIYDMKEPAEPISGLFVPRPDRNMGTLQIISIFGGLLGLDHFYLRSPSTGLVKCLTLGGFGLWWLWDIAQTWTVKERVVNYGLVSPFDIWTNIGQGMIYTDKTYYEQNTSFSMWMFGVIFGFLGIDMFVLDRFWLGFRKLVIFFIAFTVLSSLYFTGIFNVGFFGSIWVFGVLFFALGAGLMWYNDVSKVFNNPEKILSTGLKQSRMTKDSLGWIRSLYQFEGNIIGSKLNEEGKSVLDNNGKEIKDPNASKIDQRIFNDWTTINENYMFKDIDANELINRFWIGFAEERPVGGPTNLGSNANPGAPPVTITIRIFEIVYNWISETIKETVEFIVMNFTPAGKALQMGMKTAETALKKVEKSGIVGKISGSLDKLGSITEKVTQGVGSLTEKVSHGVGSLTEKVTDSLGTVSQGVGSLTGNVTQGVVPTSLQTVPTPLPAAQAGGSRSTPLSIDAQILGATVTAIVAGGLLKGIVDYLMTE